MSVAYLSQNLTFLRQQKNLKPEEMARILGIWESTLRQYEQGREEPDMATLVDMSEKLNLPIDHLLKRDLEGQQSRIRRQKIKLVLLDVDGTLTDGGMYYGEGGEELKKFNVKDGMAINRVIKNHAVRFGFISAASTPRIVEKRAEVLGVSLVYAGTRPKVKVIEGWLEGLSLSWKQVAYAGDDLNDIEVLQKAGLSACPADAAAPVKAVCDVILSKAGGQGCIRELLEQVLGFELTK